MFYSKLLAPLLLLAIALSGCTTASGPAQIMTSAGPTAAAKSYTTGLAGRFAQSEALAFTAASGGAAVSNEELTAAKRMMTDGFGLVYASCNDFFLGAGTTQKWLIVTRDAVGGVGTLATGIMAFHNTGKNAIANIAFLTGATFAGLDIYTKNFLFAAENVDSVRELILNALSTHRTAVEVKGTVTYEGAFNHILDNQDICQPAKIVALARDAIKRGVVVPSKDPSEDLALISQQQDQRALLALGQALRPPGTLSIKEAGALWWLLWDQPLKADEPTIAAMLVDVPEAVNPFTRTVSAGVTTIAMKVQWREEAQVRTALDLFSPATKASFRQAIADARSAQRSRPGEKPVEGGGSPARPTGVNTPQPGVPEFRYGEPRQAGTSSRVSVGIK